MANTIQIKRGAGAPNAGVLLDGELGFDKTNDQLYIGKADGEKIVNIKVGSEAGLENGVIYNEENQETAVVPLNADTLQGLGASAFAPAGFGLGGPCQNISDWNNATESGFVQGSVNAPTAASWYGYVVRHATGYVIQVAFTLAYGSAVQQAIRVMYGGTWQPWEYVNPPMSAGIEFRTTERYKGKAVYTMLLEGGALAAGTTTFKAHSLNAQIIRCSGNMSKDEFVTSSTIPYSYHDGTSVVSKVTIGSNANSVLVTAEVGSFSNYKFRAQIWYIKD